MAQRIQLNADAQWRTPEWSASLSKFPLISRQVLRTYIRREDAILKNYITFETKYLCPKLLLIGKNVILFSCHSPFKGQYTEHLKCTMVKGHISPLWYNLDGKQTRTDHLWNDVKMNCIYETVVKNKMYLVNS